MKFLVVGDPHVKQDELVDCENLMHGVLEVAESNPVDYIVLLGDLFHNHSIVHVSVLDFWHKWLTVFKNKQFKVIAMKGNHDFGLSDPQKHALLPFKDLCLVVDSPYKIDGMTFLPYYGPKEADTFYSILKEPSKVVFCHETFDGAKYDNGFYAPDGLDASKCNTPYIVSGHIHTPMILKTSKTIVYYLGAPRWQTVSDANIDRNIGIFDTLTFDWKLFPTANYCRQIFKTEVSGLEDLQKINKIENSQHTLILKGSKAEVEKMLEAVKNKGFLIKQSIESKEIKIKESAGIAKSYAQFVKDKVEELGYPANIADEIVKEATWIRN